jgi:hypothetical protein
LITLNSYALDVSAAGIVFEYTAFAKRFDGNLRSTAIFQLIPHATIN